MIEHDIELNEYSRIIRQHVTNYMKSWLRHTLRSVCELSNMPMEFPYSNKECFIQGIPPTVVRKMQDWDIKSWIMLASPFLVTNSFFYLQIT